MKEHLKKLKADFLLSSMLCIVLGILLMLRGEQVLRTLGKVFGFFILLIGGIYLFGILASGPKSKITAIIGGIISLIGLWILLKPEVVVSIVPIVIGVLIVFHGIKQLMLSFESKQYGYQNWAINTILGVISILLGGMCIIHAFGIMKITFVIIGLSLVYNGVSDIWVATRTTKAEKYYHNGRETIDIEFNEDK